ncbi:MAG TPA: ubiquinone/menaquinone biosynthesis methyltransferase [Herpetosiphonaceae bacterium]|nr:ubiquinone/menaquinone biosynthesis methyltransferase [Herpetosiphonaceae bacterium]
MSVLPVPEQKAIYVRRMFGAIAARYDRVNRVMTFGLDQGWRRFAVDEVAAAVPTDAGHVVMLDVGTGTGDFLPLLRRVLPDATVVGVDFSLPMMQAGWSKAAGPGGGGFTGGDALRLPFPDDAFDGVTTGFTMRNVADLPAALQEMLRVTRPGQRLACLEVAQPANALIRAGHQVYFNRVVPLLAGAISGNRTAYTYLPQSAQRFPLPDELCKLLRAAGWSNPRYHLLGLGAVAVHVAEKLTTDHGPRTTDE